MIFKRFIQFRRSIVNNVKVISGKFNYFMLLKIVSIRVDRADPDEMPLKVVSHLGLLCHCGYLPVKKALTNWKY